MNTIHTILGIDVAKDKFDVCLLTPQGPRPRTFANTPRGHAALLGWCMRQGAHSLHVCLEATSRYGETLAQCCHQAGHTVSVVNPARIHYYAQSTLARNKTDRVDAALIADFARTQSPRPWQPLTSARADLQALTRQRATLVNDGQRYQNQLATARPCVRPLLRQLIRTLERTVKKLDDQIQHLLNREVALQPAVRWLQTIPGLGAVSAAALVAELPPDLVQARQAVAWAGLNPRQRQSGSSLAAPPHLSKTGSRHVRRLLYMPALSALRCNPPIRALAQRLRCKGKPGKVIACAAMRKLLHQICGVLKHRRAFDPNWLRDSARCINEPPGESSEPQRAPGGGQSPPTSST